jgi:hypothetical protein
MIHSFFQTKQKLHSFLRWGLAGFIFLFLFTACDLQEGEPFDGAYLSISYEIVYQADATNEYLVKFGDYSFDSIRHNVNVFERDSTSKLDVWLLNTDATNELQMDTLLTLNRSNLEIQLIQLASGEPMQLFNQPDYPDSASVQRTQLFYSTATLPDSVKVTLVAVDRYNFTVTAGNNFSKANPIDTVTTFTLKRNTLSPFIDLDLNYYNGGTRGYEAYFYYSITNATTGAVVQALNKNVRLKVEQASTATTDRFNAKYKFALMQWSYSSSYLFNTPSVLVGTSW